MKGIEKGKECVLLREATKKRRCRGSDEVVGLRERHKHRQRREGRE